MGVAANLCSPSGAAPPTAAPAPPPDDLAWRDEIRQVLLASGLCGLLLGFHCGWQIAVESAQAVAGLAVYPLDNPFYMYHVKSWTLLHQLPALLLRCGASESAVSIGLGGLIGAISFQAVALCAFAFGRHRLLAIVAPLLVHITNASRDLESVHQIRLLSHECWMTYGVMGVSWALLAWSLLGVGCRRWAALLMGLGLAVHPLLGAWCLAIGAAALVWTARREAISLRSELRWLAAGLALSLASFVVQCLLARGLPAVDGSLARELTAAFARGWDNHRVRVPVNHFAILTAACAAAIGGVYLRFGGAALPPRSHALLRALALSAPLGLLLGLLTNCQEHLPMPFVLAMPGRFNDVVALAFPPLVLGLLARQRSNLAMHCLLSLVLVYCLLKTNMMVAHRIYVPAAPKILLAAGLGLLLVSWRLVGGGQASRVWRSAHWHGLRAAVAAVLASAVYVWRRDHSLAQAISIAALALVLLSHSPRLWRRLDADSLGWRVAPRLLSLIDAACLLKIAAAVVGIEFTLGLAAGGAWLSRNRWLPAVDRWGRSAAVFRFASLAALACVCCYFSGAKLIGQAAAGRARLRDRTNDPLLAAVSQGTGLALTASRIELLQLQTRRGVLLYGAAMNQLTYVPDSAPKMNEILRRIYGDDLLSPRPPGWVRCGGLMMDSGRGLWAEREPEEWIRLAREFGFSDVVTYADWTVKLPLVARNNKYALYRVPDAAYLPAFSFNSASMISETSLPSVGE